ncbi:hypothetical protein [Burkholderia ambifaria]|uniref:hypothetical protein n=2 Tax=Burkholderia ambifaria TaxID=152480 RepID=UPI00158AFF95|nr:hypothetical protein [Burkholderia ambifaria]
MMLSACACTLAVMPIMAAAATVGGTPDNLAFRSMVAVDSQTVLLKDVADLDALPEGIRSVAANVAVLDLNPSPPSVDVDARRLAANARRQLPILTPWLANIAPQTIRITRRDTPYHGHASPPAPSCIALLRDLAPGSALPAGQFIPASCRGDEAHRAWRYDVSARVARATRMIRAGDVVIAPTAQRAASVTRGETVIRRVQVGATSVTRSGVALVDAGLTRALQVRTGDGNVNAWRDVVDSGGR